MLENFGGNGDADLKTSWYDSIKEITVYTSGELKYAVVKLSNQVKAAHIMNSILLYGEERLEKVEVQDNDGNYITEKSNWK